MPQQINPPLPLYPIVAIPNAFNLGLTPAACAPPLSFATSAAMFMLGEEKDLFGRIRLGGTIGFGSSTLIVGMLVENSSLKMAFWVAAVLIFAGLLVSFKSVYGQEKTEPAAGRHGLGDLLRNPNWLLFLFIAFIAGVALAAANSYFYPYLQELGAGESTIGLALTVGTIAEIPVLLLANHFIRRFNAYGTLILSLAFTSLRLILACPLFVVCYLLSVDVLHRLRTIILDLPPSSHFTASATRLSWSSPSQ
jgi:PPP family 3-phenylpropionic acid transporter